jgi:hypothetical protein
LRIYPKDFICHLAEQRTGKQKKETENEWTDKCIKPKEWNRPRKYCKERNFATLNLSWKSSDEYKEE